jgi:branched-chain amino acid transport system substrate-binding protein
VLVRVRRSMSGLLALLAVTAMAACTARTPPKNAPGAMTIGLLVPATGATAGRGKSAKQGAELAIDVVNNNYPDLPLPLGPGTGLRNGTRIELAVGDTQGAAERVEEQVNLLVQHGAVGLVLADDVAVARAAGRQADLMSVALVDATSTADFLSDLNRSGHYRIQPSDRNAVQTAFDLLYRERTAQKPASRVALAVGTSDEEVDGIKRAVSDLGSAGGYTVPTATVSLTTPAADTATQVLASKADVVFAVVTSDQEAAAASDLAVRLRNQVPVVALGRGAAGLDTTKATSQGVLRAIGWSAEYARRNPIARAVAAVYEQRYGVSMTDVAAATFTATLAFAYGMDQVGASSVATARSGMQRMSMAATQTIMPWDGIRFDGNGNNVLAAAVVEQRASGGFQVVHPSELSVAALAWP